MRRNALAAYNARHAEFHAYIKVLAAACDLEHHAQLSALVEQMPEDRDAVWSMFDHTAYDLRTKDVVRCCRARRVLDAARRKVAA